MKIPLLVFRGNNQSDESVSTALGPLERKVMEAVWQRSKVNVRDIQLALGDSPAYTTVMTTLDRLYKKGLLDRCKEGRAFSYSPRLSPSEVGRGAMRELIDRLLGRPDGDDEPVLSCFVDAVTDRDHELLDHLDRLIRAKRRELDGKE